MNKRQTKPWTKGEVERLNKLIAGRLTVDQICHRLSRSDQDVSEKITGLAIAVPEGFFARPVYRSRK